MLKNNQIPVLTDLIEKGIDIKSDELNLNQSEDLILGLDDREEPRIDANHFDFETETEVEVEVEVEVEEVEVEVEEEPVNHALKDDPALEKIIRRILNEHMELALTEIKLAIKKTHKTR